MDMSLEYRRTIYLQS